MLHADIITWTRFRFHFSDAMPAEPRAVRPRPPAPCSGLRDDRLSAHGADVKTKNTGDSITGMMRSMTQEEMLELCWIDK